MYPYEPERNSMIAKMKKPEAKEIYKLRQQIVEPAIGDIKRETKACEHFLPEEGAKAEFNLTCTARNLKKIWLSWQKKEETRDKRGFKVRPQPSFNLVFQFT